MLANRGDLRPVGVARTVRDRRQRRLERWQRGLADDEIVRIERGPHATTMSVTVDERVIDDPVPTARELAAELGAPGKRGQHPRVGFRLKIEGELNLIPLTDLQGADGLPGIGAATEKFGPIEVQLHRCRTARSVPEVVPPRTIATRVLTRAPKVEANEEPPVFVGFHTGKRLAEAIVFSAIRHVDAKPARGGDISERALRRRGEFHHAVRPRPPRRSGRHTIRLQLKLTVDAHKLLQVRAQPGEVRFVTRRGDGRQCGRDRRDWQFLRAEVVEIERGQRGVRLIARIEHGIIDRAGPCG